MSFRKLAPVLFILLLAACQAAAGSAPAAEQPLAQEPLIIYGWSGYMPQAILDTFTAAYGVPTRYMTYDDQEVALQQLRQGTDRYDVVVLGDTNLAAAVAEGLLAELDYQNIPNFRNLGANFRDLSYDPENRYSIMIQWGTTGLVARTDRLTRPVTAWADLWDPTYAGKIGVWPYANDLIGITLKSLGYSLNTDDPAELMAAEEKLLQLRRNVYLLDLAQATGVGNLQDNHTAMIYGWSYDAMQAQRELPTAAYVLPQEGTILWSDSVTIPARSRHKQQAELFINFLLEPEISAKMVNELWIRSPNEAATPWIDPQILDNPVVYPPGNSLEQAEFFATVSPETRTWHERIWLRFLTAEGPVSGAPSIP